MRSKRCWNVGRGNCSGAGPGDSFDGLVDEKRECFAKKLDLEEAGGTPSHSGTW